MLDNVGLLHITISRLDCEFAQIVVNQCVDASQLWKMLCLAGLEHWQIQIQHP